MLIFIIILILCLFFPERALNSVTESVSLWANNVLPSLLPFMILSKSLFYSGGVKLFSHILKPVMRFLLIPDKYAFAFTVSLLCGYPTGSATVALLFDTNEDIEFYPANICFSSGPIFIIGTVGTLFLQNGKTGASLYIIHICALIILSLFLSPKRNIKKDYVLDIEGGMGEAVGSAVSGILNVCGYMVFFGLMCGFIKPYLPENILIKGLVCGMFEFTSGISILSQSIENLPFISFLLSFGGGCVIFQSLAYLKGINKLKFILMRFFSGIIAFILCFIYTKTALYVPLAITFGFIALKHIYGRKHTIY